MKTTISTKLNCTLLHRIDEFCQKNHINRSQWMQSALADRLKKDKILIVTDQPQRTIASKIEKKE